MGNWLSAEPGLSSADTVQIPSGQRDDNRRGGEEGKGRNRDAVEGYKATKGFIAQCCNYLWICVALFLSSRSCRLQLPVQQMTRDVVSYLYLYLKVRYLSTCGKYFIFIVLYSNSMLYNWVQSPKLSKKLWENEHENRQHCSEIFLLTSNFITSWSVFANHCYLVGPLSFSCTVGALQHTNFFY